MKDKCYGGKNGWHICTVCEGRIHDAGCTTKRNKYKDCCAERHELLNKMGITKGIADSSFPMLGTHAE